MSTTEPEKKRRYQHVWDRLIEAPDKQLAVKVTKKEMLARVRKAVWKEKDICPRKNNNGTPLKKLYRLSVEILEAELKLIFKLTPTNHQDNL